MDFPSGRLDLFMIDISEPRDNDLRVVVVVATTLARLPPTTSAAA